MVDSGYSVLQIVVKSRSYAHTATGKNRSIGKSSNLNGNRTCGPPANSIVPQSTTLQRAPQTLALKPISSLIEIRRIV
jgi:hypothetical protein